MHHLMPHCNRATSRRSLWLPVFRALAAVEAEVDAEVAERVEQRREMMMFSYCWTRTRRRATAAAV